MTMMIDLPIYLVNRDYWRMHRARLLPTIAMHHAHFASYAIFEFCGEWSVTHVETGCSVTRGKTFRQTVLMARSILSRVSAEHHARTVAKLPKKCRT